MRIASRHIESNSHIWLHCALTTAESGATEEQLIRRKDPGSSTARIGARYFWIYR